MEPLGARRGVWAGASRVAARDGALDAGVTDGMPDSTPDSTPDATIDATIDALLPLPDLAVAVDLPTIPEYTVACEHPEFWPLSVPSAIVPVVVHYRQPDEATEAAHVLSLVESAWAIEIDQLGFSAPRPDDGACGDDDRFDVFLWRGHEECYVDVIGVDPTTSYGAQRSFLVVDPWGPFGGALLPATVAHELNHACQASDDWDDAAPIYEMTSVLMEEAVVDDDDGYHAIAADFQARPDWSIDRDDDYDTWFMYGASLYLMYLRDRFFAGHYEFAATLWHGMRNANSDDNEPDFVDALDVLLAAHGSSYVASVAEFARWRWYTGTRADGHHLREAEQLPEVAIAGSYRVDQQRSIALSPAPMLLGTSYVALTRQAGDAARVQLSLKNASPDCTWHVQVVPGSIIGSDGETVTFVAGKATIELGSLMQRTVIVTALPSGGYDPDDRDDTRYDATLVVKPLP